MSYPTFDLANAHFVTDRLAVGGDLAMDDDEACSQAVELINAGITHVLDVRSEYDDAALWECAPEVSYRWDGIADAGQRVPAAWFDRIVTWALKALEQPGTKVLTHCHMGINRGPSAGFAVLLGLGWEPVEAIAAIRAARPIANVWYAEDALAWHFSRSGTPAVVRRAVRARFAAWRRENPLDVVRIIRGIRAAEAS